MQAKFISQSKLGEWLGELGASFKVWAPRYEGKAKSGAVVFRPYVAGTELELNKKPTESAKHVIFPRSEALINYRRNQDPATPGKPALQLEVPKAPEASLVFGLLPCDARGFMVFDPVYNGSGTGGKAKDIYYLRRRSNTVLIAIACAKVFGTCFCNWVGGSPSSTEGADVLATAVANGYMLMPVTPEGEAVLTSALLSDAAPEMLQEAEQSHQKAAAALKPAQDVADAVEALVNKFEDAAFWQAESAHCLSCGACTYLCPTCYCFNVTDESAGLNGVRLRNWDACMTPLFTLEASGHNPRMQKAMRLKNRVGHKFSYYPALHEQRIACVGCGRCIKSCPSGVDIRRIVTDAIGITKAQEIKGKE
ncbi:4Fe-4S dicluster domain-containing protein [Desulfovibrio sp. OttesenSCG-928-F07]|nr:4Fe-4S dicluster domain-containing protein [Desulfovibrio sp. OttesenSCG-928-F07]